MSAPKTPRDAASRQSSMRPEVSYVPPSTLPTPDPIPGAVFRWVAMSVMGVADPANMSKKLREGWEPVKAEDHPELCIPGNANGNVEIGGLILCRGTVEQARARDAYYNKQAAQQMESVDNSLMQQSDPRMPLFKERTSEVSRGRGFGTGSK